MVVQSIKAIHPQLVPGAHEVSSVIRLTAFLAVSPEQVWARLRSFNSGSGSEHVKIIHQESYRKLTYAMFGLPRVVKRMIGQIDLQPDGPGTRFYWSIHFSTKATLLARFLRPLLRISIGRTLRNALREFKRAVEVQ